MVNESNAVVSSAVNEGINHSETIIHPYNVRRKKIILQKVRDNPLKSDQSLLPISFNGIASDQWNSEN